MIDASFVNQEFGFVRAQLVPKFSRCKSAACHNFARGVELALVDQPECPRSAANSGL
jgi:hypothetical protein